MKIAVTGATGTIGKDLVPFLVGRGHLVTRLVRQRERAGQDSVYWNPERGEIDARGLEGQDVLIHLAAENAEAPRWSRAKRARIRESRLLGTRLLADTLANAVRPPRTFLAASSVSIYGNCGDDALPESRPAGDGFLAEVMRAAEAESERAARAGVRVVNLRLGGVLSTAGGLLPKSAPSFRFGLGGTLGDGQQFVPWVAIEDVLGAVGHLLEAADVAGPVNVVAPHPVRNEEFTRTLARVLGAPVFLSYPAALLRLACGAAADDLLLASKRAEPRRLLAAGFLFQHAELEPALRALLGRPRPAGRPRREAPLSEQAGG